MRQRAGPPARSARTERNAHGQPTERRRRAEGACRQGLKRTLGLREAITITAGTVIGVGLFTTGGNVVGEMGPFVVLATALAALIEHLPGAHVRRDGRGAALRRRHVPVRVAWAWGAERAILPDGTSSCRSSLSPAARRWRSATTSRPSSWRSAIELPVDDVVIAIIALVAFIIANVRGVELTGKLQNGLRCSSSGALPPSGSLP